MNYRRASQAAEWAVVAAVVGLHVFVYGRVQEQPAPRWLQVAADVQPLVIVALLVAWALLGPGWRWTRLTLGSLIGMLCVVLVAAEPDGIGSAFPFLYTVAFAVVCMLAPARLSGLKVLRTPAYETVGKLQFSIRSLLVVTTLVALAIGGLQLLRPAIASHEAELADFRVWLIEFERLATFGRVEVARGLVPTPATLRQAVLALAVAASAAGSLATVLRPGSVWLRLGMLAVAIPAGATYLAHLTGAGSTFGASAGELAAAFAAVAALVAVSVLPMRLMGYRLRKWKSGPAAPAGQASPTSAQSPFMSNGDSRTTLRPKLQEIAP